MAPSIRRVQQATFSVVVVMGIALAAGFSWATFRIDAIDISLSNERVLAAEVTQMKDRLDVILTAADLTLNGGETYTAQWASSRAQELESAVQEFRRVNPNYWPADENRGFTDDLKDLSELITSEQTSQEGVNAVIGRYDAIALRLVETITDALEYSNYRVTAAELQRTENALFITTGLIGGTLLFLISSLIASNYATRQIVRPLELLGIEATAEHNTDSDSPILKTAPKEIQQVADAFSNFTETLSSRVKKRTAQLQTTTDELKKENKRRRRVEADLQVALEETRSASAAKTAFLSVMSHELRTPMNAVMGALHIIKSEPLSENQKHLVNTAHDAGDFLVSLLTDVLDISKIDSDGIEVDKKPTNLQAFLTQFERQVSIQIASADCSWALSLDEDIAAWVLIDQNRLKQVLTNFVGNACKFAKGSALRLRVERSKNAVQHCIRFALTDKGPGISDQYIEDIFEPFNQVESNLDRESGGVGLGLAICNRLAKAMDGDCGVESKVGMGSTFFVEIPCLPVDEPEEKRDEARNGESGSVEQIKDDSQLEVLLVEDSQVNQLIARTMLEKRGMQVTSVESGLEAIEMASKQRFDVILMDLQMPGMDGIAAASRILDSEGPNVMTPIIPMTANVGPEFESQTQSAGMIGFIAKPLKPEVMMNAIFSSLRQVHESSSQPDQQ